MHNKYICGFDIGATKITLVVADLRNEIIYRKKVTIDEEGKDFGRFRDGWSYNEPADQLIELVENSPCSPGKISAIGIGTAGPLEEGAIKNSTNIKPKFAPEKEEGSPIYIPLVQPLQERLRVPVRVENDCIAGVLGEVYFGRGAEVKDKNKLFLVYITLSTGFGGGAWDGGKLITGKEGNASEVGHFPVKEGGLKCGCGNYGCAESYCSGTGITKNARMKLVNEDLKFKEGFGGGIKRLARNKAKEQNQKIYSDWDLLRFVDAPIVCQAKDGGDRLALQVFEEAGHCGGVALSCIANAYDPEVITVGGALALENPDLLDLIEKEMQRHLNVTPPKIKLTELGYRTVEYGAISMARELID